MAASPGRLKVFIVILRFGDPTQVAAVQDALGKALAGRPVDAAPLFANQIEALKERMVYYRDGFEKEGREVASALGHSCSVLTKEHQERCREAGLVVVPGGAREVP